MSRLPSAGLKLWTLLGLAALGLPRVVMHDLHLADPVTNAVLVFVPIAVWIGWVLWRRVPAPLYTLLLVGVIYGVLLAITHQILWTEAFAGGPPELGGNLAGRLSPALEELVMRLAAFGSGVATGAVLGAVTGAVAWMLARIVGGSRQDDAPR
ncbi:hypothetical protein [Nocardia rhamnosiphila]